MDNEFNKLKNYMNNRLEIFPDDDELKDIMDLAVQQDAYENNKGYKWERCKDNPREMAFYEQWLKENQPLSWVNNGHGILQDLFIERNITQPLGQTKWIVEINNRDRWIVATIIQWLGTNVGFCFLQEALRRCGYTIVQSKREVV
jgi:hypothetical protein